MTRDKFHQIDQNPRQEPIVESQNVAQPLTLEEVIYPVVQNQAANSRSQRNSGEISPSTSIYSTQSFSSMLTHETEATDFLLSPNISRANTLNRSRIRPSIASTGPARKPPIRIVLGTASIGSDQSKIAKITTVEQTEEFLDLFHRRGYLDIDTARAYPVGRGGTCEKLLGQPSIRLSKWANVSTKVSSFIPGSHKAKNIVYSINKSLESLNVESVDIMYLHAPDHSTSFQDTCRAMHQAFLEGKFERFGLSNYSIQEVEEIIHVCHVNDFVKPSVYQGQYNPICRGAEQELFELLRKHQIAFYAYSPSACGFFSDKFTRASAQDGDSRWAITSPLGAKYVKDYFHDILFAAADFVRKEAKKYCISGHAAALRWTTWHSELEPEFGDAIIIGASKLSQLQENLEILEQGPLPEALVEVINSVWEDVKYLQNGPRFSFV